MDRVAGCFKVLPPGWAPGPKRVWGLFRNRGDGLGRGLHEEFDFGFRDGQRGHEHDDISQGAKDDTMAADVLADVVADEAGGIVGFFRCSIFHEFDAHHKPLLADLAAMRERGDFFRQQV